MISYFNGQFLEHTEIMVSPFDRGFLFADGIYEAIRTYHGKLFRYEDHLERLKKSLQGIRLEFQNIDGVEQIIYKLIQRNTLAGEVLVYLQITRGASFPRMHSFPKEKVEPTIFISVQELNEKPEEQQNGIKVILQEDLRWMRCDIKSISLLPAILANQKAVEAHADEAILVRNGLITEGTHTNFFAVRNGEVVTAPLSNLILDGVTRKVVLELCRRAGVKVREELIRADELKSYDEFFVTSTTKEITPVVMIDGAVIGNGNPGVLTLRLLSQFKSQIK
jgi:D-alanine transaminase